LRQKIKKEKTRAEEKYSAPIYRPHLFACKVAEASRLMAGKVQRWDAAATFPGSLVPAPHKQSETLNLVGFNLRQSRLIQPKMKKHFSGQLAAVAGLPPPPRFRLRQGFGGQVGVRRRQRGWTMENGQLSPEPSSCQKSGCAPSFLRWQFPIPNPKLNPLVEGIKMRMTIRIKNKCA
jgi:hypothetical protein